MPARAGLAGDHNAAGILGGYPVTACGRDGGTRYPRSFRPVLTLLEYLEEG